ncbi:MAG: hypothetical protein PHH52_02360 [Patescibacteria group bacterium]|nr:hypothetical protein [Patescibacteria group bacterium]
MKKSAFSLFFLLIFFSLLILGRNNASQAAYLPDPITPPSDNDSNWENNDSEEYVESGSLPDLVLKEISISSSEADKLNVTYCNYGADANTDTSQISIILDSGSAVMVEAITMPRAGECLTKEHGDLTSLNINPSFNYEIAVYLDKDNKLKETNEVNNNFFGKVRNESLDLIEMPEEDIIISETKIENDNLDSIEQVIGGLSLCFFYQDEKACRSFRFIPQAFNLAKTKAKITVSDSNKSLVSLVLDRMVSGYEKQLLILEERLTQIDSRFAQKQSGKMLLDVENKGHLWYVDQQSKQRFYLQDGKAALSITSKLALGISYEDINKIPLGVFDKLYNLEDSDSDGLPDRLENAIGLDCFNKDSDNDGRLDKEDVLNAYHPIFQKSFPIDKELASRLEGRMLIQVDGPYSHGEIWYVLGGKRWYAGTTDSMYEIMRTLSLGALSSDIRKIGVGGLVPEQLIRQNNWFNQ